MKQRRVRNKRLNITRETPWAASRKPFPSAETKEKRCLALTVIKPIRSYIKIGTQPTSGLVQIHVVHTLHSMVTRSQTIRMVKVQLLLLRFQSIASLNSVSAYRATRLRTTRALIPDDTGSATIKLTQWPKQGAPKAFDLLRHGRRAKERSGTR